MNSFCLGVFSSLVVGHRLTKLNGVGNSRRKAAAFDRFKNLYRSNRGTALIIIGTEDTNARGCIAFFLAHIHSVVFCK